MRRTLIAAILAAALSAPPWESGSAQDPPAALRSADAPPGTIWLDSLDLTRMVQRRGAPRPGRSGFGRGTDPPPLSLGVAV